MAPAVPLSRAQFRLSSAAQVSSTSAVASGKRTRSVAVSSTCQLGVPARLERALTAMGVRADPALEDVAHVPAVIREDPAAGDGRIDPPVVAAARGRAAGRVRRVCQVTLVTRPMAPSATSARVWRTMGA